MKIKDLFFEDVYQDKRSSAVWYSFINVNGINETYQLVIEDGTTKIKIYYEDSKYSKKELDDLLKEMLKIKEVKEKITIIEKMTEEIEKIKKMKMLNNASLDVLKYDKKEDFEHFSFVINNGLLIFNYSLDEKMEQFYAHAYVKENETLFIQHIDTYFSKEINDELVNLLRNHFKIRVKRIF